MSHLTVSSAPSPPKKIALPDRLTQEFNRKTQEGDRAASTVADDEADNPYLDSYALADETEELPNYVGKTLKLTRNLYRVAKGKIV